MTTHQNNMEQNNTDQYSVTPQDSFSPSPYEAPQALAKISSVKKKVKRIGVLKLGIIQGVIGVAMGLLIWVPYGLIMMAVGGMGVGSEFGAMAGAGGALMGVIFMIAFPVMYGVFGFIGGCIIAFVYNLISGWVGGIEVELEDA